MIVIEFRPSRLLPVILIGGHVAAAFSFLLGFGWGWPMVPAVAVFGLSLMRALGLARCGPRRLGLADDGVLVLEPDGGIHQVLVVPRPSTVVLSWAAWLAWREEEGVSRGVMLILPDQLSPAAWRELQVWARLRARPQAAGPGQA